MALVVAAINLGGTSAGWAYSFRFEFERDPEKIHTKNSCMRNLIATQTSSCLLVNPDGKTIETFGYDAECKFAELVEDDEHKQYYFFTKLSILMRKSLKQKGEKQVLLEDENGKFLPALTVLSIAFQYLKDDLQTHMLHYVSGDIRFESDVHVVLIVPGYFQMEEIELTRKAAQMAGVNAKEVSILTDLDAASVFFRQHSTKRNSEDQSSYKCIQGEKCLVVKVGGETTSTTVHEMEMIGDINEVTNVTTDYVGGTMVNKAVFVDLMEEVFGKEVFDNFKSSETEDYLDMVTEVEVKKRSFNPSGQGWVTLKIPVSLIQATPGERVQRSEDVILRGYKLRVSSKLFLSFFKEATEKVIGIIQTALSSSGARVLLVFGGFSESAILVQAIQRAFPHVRILIHPEGTTLSLKGAVIAGHSQIIVKKMMK